MDKDQKIAVVDLGTNTFHLLIVEVSQEGKITTLFKEKIPVKIGNGSLKHNIIAPDAYLRGIDSMNTHAKTIKEFQTNQVFAFATSAIRSTQNGVQFVDEVYAKTGISIQIISGDQEALYIYEGVKAFCNLANGPHLIMDIGGGSTEFILCDDKQVLWKKSYDLGVSRLKQYFQPEDPLKETTIQKIQAYLLDELEELFNACKQYSPLVKLIGSSGAFESFAMMIEAQKENEFHPEKGYNFNLQELTSMHQFLLKSSQEERLATPGLVEMRAEFITFGSLLTQVVINQLDIKHLELSDFALKEGVLQTILKHQ